MRAVVCCAHRSSACRYARSQIHIIPEGLEQLSGESLGLDYPLGGIPVALGLLSMVLVDYLASYLMSSRQVRRAAAASAGAAANAHARPSGKGSSGGGGAVALPPCCDSAASGDAEQGGFVALPSGDAAAAVPAAAAAAAPMTGASTFLAHSHHHHHLPTCEITSIRRCVAAYTMELGCVFHSVIIGVSIGVVTSSPRLLVVMTAVMIAHQLLEGLALGTMLAAATLLAGWKKALMAAAYALCMPLGIAIGIGVADSYAPDSLASLATQGTLNAFSGGMLLAVSMFSLVGEEFSKSDLLARPGLAAALAAAVLAGVGGMAVIGIWG